jgi:hypothetical protein
MRSRNGAIIVLGVVALVVGLWGVIAALGFPFTVARGAPLGRFIHLSELGAIVTLVGGVALVAAPSAQRRLAAIGGGLLFGAATVWTFVGLHLDTNPLGGRANTFAFFLMLTIGLLVLGFAPLEGDDATA